MNGLDIALTVVLLFFLLRGIFRGFIKEIIGVIGLAAGFYLASKYYPAMAEHIKPFVQNLAYRQAIGFQVIFLTAFFIISLIGVLIDKLIKLTISAFSNGVFGAVIGLTKGVVLCAVVLMATTAFIRPDAPLFKSSIAWPYMEGLTGVIREMAPEDLREATMGKVEKLPTDLKPAVPGPGPDGAAGEEAPPWKSVTPEPGGSPPPALPSGSPSASPPPWPGFADQ
jgi:membrane protein required for colicin V production